MEIEEKDLQYLLENKKHHIKTKDTLIQNLICLIVFLLSLLLANFTDLSLTKKIAIITLGVIYFIIFGLSVYGSNYSVEALLHDICSCSKVHPFSLIVIKNKKGEYLLKKDNRWKTYLFPYKRTHVNDLEDLKNFMASAFGVNDFNIVKTEKTSISKHSVSAQTIKTYEHTFYKIDFDFNLPPEKNKFKINKSIYKWFTIDEIKANKDMISKNKETIDFVEANF